MIDQKKLKASCIPYTVRAARFGFPDVSTRYEAIPIRMYKIVHTTGNSHPGGESSGLFNDWKTSIPPRVKSADKPPTASGSTIHKINFFHKEEQLYTILNNSKTYLLIRCKVILVIQSTLINTISIFCQ